MKLAFSYALEDVRVGAGSAGHIQELRFGLISCPLWRIVSAALDAVDGLSP